MYNYKIQTSHDFIKMIDDIDFLYGFIYECATLINNLFDYNNYDHVAIKLCSEFIMSIINITKKEHIKEYNECCKCTYVVRSRFGKEVSFTGEFFRTEK